MNEYLNSIAEKIKAIYPDCEVFLDDSLNNLIEIELCCNISISDINSLTSIIGDGWECISYDNLLSANHRPLYWFSNDNLDAVVRGKILKDLIN